MQIVNWCRDTTEEVDVRLKQWSRYKSQKKEVVQDVIFLICSVVHLFTYFQSIPKDLVGLSSFFKFFGCFIFGKIFIESGPTPP